MIKVNPSPYIVCSLIAFLFLMACKKEGPAGKNSLIDQIPEPAGENCSSGGYKIISGLDENRNNVLDSNEIQKTTYVCNGNTNKETILKISDDIGYWTTSTNGLIHPTLSIENFNITNYLADSASFYCYLKTEAANVKCFIELYDLTNNRALNNTLLTSNATAYELKISTVNFINEFPQKSIKLGCRIRAEKDGTMVTISKPELRLYRK